MLENTTITMSGAEFERLVRDSERLNAVRWIVEHVKYPIDEVRAALSVEKKDD